MAVATKCTEPDAAAARKPSEISAAFMRSIDRVASEARRYADSLDDGCDRAARRAEMLRDRVEALVVHPALGEHPTCWGSSPNASDVYDGGCPKAATHEPIGLCDVHHGEIVGTGA
jgi:hypothetical protein